MAKIILRDKLSNIYDAPTILTEYVGHKLPMIGILKL